MASKVFITYLLLFVDLYYCSNNTNSNDTSATITSSINSLIDGNMSKTNMSNIVITDSTTIQTILNDEVNLTKNATNITTVSSSITANTTDQNSTDTKEIISQGAVQEKPGTGVMNYFRTLFKEKPALGENCTIQADCEGSETICQDGTCQCLPDYVPALDNRRCLKIVTSLGSGCMMDAQCYIGLNLPEGDALCVSFKCVCGTDTIYRNGTCLRSIYIGDKCESDNDCLTVNSRCVQGVCACPMNMIPAARNKTCLLALKSTGSKCIEDAQCQELMGDFALCQNDTCICKPRSHFNSTKCAPDLKLGSSCNQTSDCQVSDPEESKYERICVDNKCTCANGNQSNDAEDACQSSGSSSLFSSNIIIYTTLLIAVIRICTQ